MSVELLDNPRFFGFRVRRQIDGKTYQEYFSLKANGKRMRGAARAEVKAVAEARDATLKELQQKNRDRKDKEIEWIPRANSRHLVSNEAREERHAHSSIPGGCDVSRPWQDRQYHRFYC